MRRLDRLTPTALALALAGMLSPAPPATAQSWTEAPAHASVVSGQVVLERAPDTTALEPGALLIPGDRLRASAGRAELLDAWWVLHLDRHSAIRLDADAVWMLERGRLHVAVTANDQPRRGRSRGLRIATTTVEFEEPGEYDLGLSAGSASVTVWRGSATLRTAAGDRHIGSGARYLISPAAPPRRVALPDAASRDDFLRWVRERLAARLSTNGSTRLDGELSLYRHVLETHGTWQQDPLLGSIWYPPVASSWTPYSAGHWVQVPSIGATWVGHEPWSWPTHHYGRWGIRGRSWYWRPGDRWAPGWVQWAIAPQMVGWCALGIDDRPASRLPVGRDLFTADGAYAPRGGWTFSTRRSFVDARSDGVPMSGPDRQPPVFVTQRTAPRVADRPDARRSTRVVRIVGTRATEGRPPAARTSAPARRPATSRTAGLRRSVPAPATTPGIATRADRLPRLRAGLPYLSSLSVPLSPARAAPPAGPTTAAAPGARSPRAPSRPRAGPPRLQRPTGSLPGTRGWIAPSAASRATSPSPPAAGSPARAGSARRPVSAGLVIRLAPTSPGPAGPQPSGIDLFRAPVSGGGPPRVRREEN